MSRAYLQYNSINLFDNPLNVTLTFGSTEKVYCVQAMGPVPTSIEWYNPQGQLVSKDGEDEVNQLGAGGDKVAHLNFKSYHQSQGGKYECRVAGPGNNTKRLSVCIGECYTFLLTVKSATSDSYSGVFPVPICKSLCGFIIDTVLYVIILIIIGTHKSYSQVCLCVCVVMVVLIGTGLEHPLTMNY